MQWWRRWWWWWYTPTEPLYQSQVTITLWLEQIVRHKSHNINQFLSINRAFGGFLFSAWIFCYSGLVYHSLFFRSLNYSAQLSLFIYYCVARILRSLLRSNPNNLLHNSMIKACSPKINEFLSSDQTKQECLFWNCCFSVFFG